MNKNFKGITFAIASASVVFLGFVGYHHRPKLSQIFQAEYLKAEYLAQNQAALSQFSGQTLAQDIIYGVNSNLRRVYQQAILNVYMQIKQDAIALESAPAPLETSPADNLEMAGDDSPHPSGLTSISKVNLTGLGPIRVGMTVAEAAAASELKLVSSNQKDQSCRYYEAKAGLQGVSFMVVDDRIIRIDIWPDSPVTTLSGAHIGMSESDIYELYPDKITTTPNPFTQGSYLIYTPNADSGESLYRLVFETNAAGKVTQFRTGQFPAVTWPKGCAETTPQI